MRNFHLGLGLSVYSGRSRSAANEPISILGAKLAAWLTSGPVLIGPPPSCTITLTHDGLGALGAAPMSVSGQTVSVTGDGVSRYGMSSGLAGKPVDWSGVRVVAKKIITNPVNGPVLLYLVKQDFSLSARIFWNGGSLSWNVETINPITDARSGFVDVGGAVTDRPALGVDGDTGDVTAYLNGVPVADKNTLGTYGQDPTDLGGMFATGNVIVLDVAGGLGNGDTYSAEIITQSDKYEDAYPSGTLDWCGNPIEGSPYVEGLFTTSTGETPVTSAGDPVGLRVNRVSGGPDAIQTTPTARPLWQTGPDRIVYDPDDALNITLPAISGGQIVISSPVGIWIGDIPSFGFVLDEETEELVPVGGTFSLGPDTYTGGPAGLWSLLGNAEMQVCILDDAMTSEEQTALVAYLVAQGSPGLIAGGANKLPTGDFESGLIGIRNDQFGSVSTYGLNTTNPISGTQDGLLNVTVSANNRPAVYFQSSLDSPLEMGKRYIFKVKMKPVSGTPALWGYSCGQSGIGFPSPVAISEGQVSFIGGPAATQNLYIYFSNLSATYSVQIDDVEVREVILP